jgi:hypothetical protein
MTLFTLTLLGILVLFILFIIFRSVTSFKVCALCAAVATAWIILLILFFVGSPIDPVFLGILMGGSIVGVLYLLERNLPERLSIFKLSFFVTLLALVYLILGGNVDYQGGIVLVLLWIVSLGIYALRTVAGFKTVAKKMIECCKNW